MYKTSFYIFLMLQVTLGFSQTLTDSFQYVVDTTFSKNPEAVGIMIHVETPEEVSWTYAKGWSDKLKEEQLDDNQAVLIASNTKTYVAAAILRLVEEKQLTLDESIGGRLTANTDQLLKQHGYDTQKITIRHLMSHTSGITDYVNDDYWTFIDKNRNYQWTRDQQIALAMKYAEPLAPGSKFAYGDINYLLLSEIIESTTQKNFNVAVSKLLKFEKHGLNNTWFETIDQRPKGVQLAHQYSEEKQWDSYELNPSWDLFGGGGLAATTTDVAKFYQLLFEGEIVKDREVLSEMLEYVLPKEQTRNYALGIYNIPAFFGSKVYYHGGWWGTDALYLPEIKTSIAIFILQKESRGLSIDIGKEIIRLIKEQK